MCSGFDEEHLPPGAPAGASYRSYLLGLSDGIAKTPEWAADITGMPAETIRRLAIEFATTKPAALQCGYAPGRTAYGEQFHRAAYALCAMTGNVGIPGGSSGVSNGATGRANIRNLPTGANPTTHAWPHRYLPICWRAANLAAIRPTSSSSIRSGATSSINAQTSTRSVGALDGVEFLVAQDHFLTPTARYADIVLPATTFWERNDVHTPWAGAGHYAIYMRQAIEPMYECRNDIDIFADLAARLGIGGYNDKTESAWLRELTRDAVDNFDAFADNGLARFAAPDDAVAFAAQIRDPQRHKFTTPSGKIEIYSMALAAKSDPYGLGHIPAVPTWSPPFEASTRYPLKLCTPKSRARTHSIHDNQPKLARVDRDDVWVHPEDARTRGISICTHRHGHGHRRIAMPSDGLRHRGVTLTPTGRRKGSCCCRLAWEDGRACLAGEAALASRLRACYYRNSSRRRRSLPLALSRSA